MPDDLRTAGLYDQDFFAWTVAQAEALRAAVSERRNATEEVFQRLDLANLAEEIESLGLRDRRELASRIATIIEHLAKLQHSPARAPRRGWIRTIARSRREIHGILDQSPSLRRAVPELVDVETPPALRLAAMLLSERAEITADIISRIGSGYTQSQILKDWWPDEQSRPAAHQRRRPTSKTE